jgi:YD repeat-containing protein
MKNFIKYLLLMLLLNSCIGTKVIFESDEETRNIPKGKIKSISFYNISLFKKVSDTIHIKVIYNNRNLPVQQIEHYENGTLTTNLFYDNNDQLIKETFEGKTLNTYTYNSKGNLIENVYYKNDTISYVKKIYYDKKNNPIKEISIKNDEIISTTNYTYDYSKNTVEIKIINTKQSNSEGYVRYTFNKKGFIIQREIIAARTLTSIIEYDKFNHIKKIANQNLTRNYINKYDEKNNIIEVVKYENDVAVRKMIYNINYKN